MTIAWVFGARGLLGSALCRALNGPYSDNTTLFVPAEHFAWHDNRELTKQITAAVQSFAATVNSNNRWELYWAAGIGTMNSTVAELIPETEALSLLLLKIQAHPQLINTPGAIAFASSAGAIYAGAKDDVITENTINAPTTAYAQAKLAQEEQIRTFITTQPHLSGLIARISTLYGPGQNSGKQQGLISHIARSMLRNQPIRIYVPYDTIRDYITVDDVATAMITTLRTLSATPGVITKIIASEIPITIAEIYALFKRIARRNPRIITSTSQLSNLYSRRIQFRSVVLPGHKTPITSMAVGIAQLMMAERLAFAGKSNTNHP